jgi:hypothetical protein
MLDILAVILLEKLSLTGQRHQRTRPLIARECCKLETPSPAGRLRVLMPNDDLIRLAGDVTRRSDYLEGAGARAIHVASVTGGFAGSTRVPGGRAHRIRIYLRDHVLIYKNDRYAKYHKHGQDKQL